MKPLRNSPPPLSPAPSRSLLALQADRFVRLEGGTQPALVVLTNNGKDMMAFGDKQSYLAEDVSLT